MRHLNYLLPALFLTACTTQPSGKTFYLLTGSYLPETEQSIHIYAFDSETGETRPVSRLSGVAYPTFFCQNEAGDVVYAVGEYDDADKATLNALHYDAQQGSLSLFSTQRSWCPMQHHAAPFGFASALRQLPRRQYHHFGTE